MYAATSFTCRKQVVHVEQQVILEEHKFYINRHKYFCPLRRVIGNRFFLLYLLSRSAALQLNVISWGSSFDGKGGVYLKKILKINIM